MQDTISRSIAVLRGRLAASPDITGIHAIRAEAEAIDAVLPTLLKLGAHTDVQSRTLRLELDDIGTRALQTLRDLSAQASRLVDLHARRLDLVPAANVDMVARMILAAIASDIDVAQRQPMVLAIGDRLLGTVERGGVGIVHDEDAPEESTLRVGTVELRLREVVAVRRTNSPLRGVAVLLGDGNVVQVRPLTTADALPADMDAAA